MASYDTRHMLTEIDPKPDQITVAIGSGLYDMTPLTTLEDVGDPHGEPRSYEAYSNMVADSTPEFYIEHLKRLRKKGFSLTLRWPTSTSSQIVERLIRQGVYMGPMNGFFSMVGGGVAGFNPFDWMELIPPDPAWLRVDVSDHVSLQLAARCLYDHPRTTHPRRHRREPLGYGIR